MTISEKARKQIAEILVRDSIESDPDITKNFLTLDATLLSALRDVGRRVVAEVGNEESRRQENAHRADGFGVESRTTTPFLPCSEKSK